MQYLKVYKNELKPILIGTAIVPVIFFVSGMFFGQMLYNQPPETTTIPSKNKVVANSQPEALKINSEDIFADKILSTKILVDETLVDKTLSDDNQSELIADQPEISPTSNAVATVINEPPLSLNTLNSYFVQAGRFTDINNALTYLSKLEAKQLDAKLLIDRQMQDEFVLILESFNSKIEATNYCLAIKKRHGIDLFVNTFINSAETNKIVLM